MEDIRNIADISGFGKDTGYEQACQNMLQSGFEWLEKQKESISETDLKAKTYKNIYGIFEPESPSAKELSKAVVAAVPDCTGAMHQAVMQHLFYIAKNGLEKWKEETKKGD